MIDNYVCENGFFHDRPSVDRKPSSNNGWIYTAMSKYALKLSFDKEDFLPIFKRCFNTKSSLYMINRLPGMDSPPISRDEIIGMASLKMPIAQILADNNFKMYKDILGEIPLIDTFKVLWKMRKEHRNHFWQNEILEAYPVAMRLFWHDRYYLKKVSGMKANILEFFMFYLYAWAIIANGGPGEQNLLYLQLKDIGSYLTIFIPYERNLLDYFGKEHIFSRQNPY